MQLEVWHEGPRGRILLPEDFAASVLSAYHDLENRDGDDYVRLQARLRWTVVRKPQPQWYKTLADCKGLVQIESFRGRLILRPHPTQDGDLIAVHAFIKQKRGTDHPEIGKAKRRDRQLLAALGRGSR